MFRQLAGHKGLGILAALLIAGVAIAVWAMTAAPWASRVALPTSSPVPPMRGAAPSLAFLGSPQMSVEEVRARLESGGLVVVDARFRTDFDESHVPGAISMPLSEIEQRRQELPGGKPVVVYAEANDCG